MSIVDFSTSWHLFSPSHSKSMAAAFPRSTAHDGLPWCQSFLWRRRSIVGQPLVVSFQLKKLLYTAPKSVVVSVSTKRSNMFKVWSTNTVRCPQSVPSEKDWDLSVCQVPSFLAPKPSAQVRTDLLEWWPLLAEGGTFCGSNYTTEGPICLFFFRRLKGWSRRLVDVHL